MAYIGNTADQQSFTPAVDFFSGNGVTVAFTLSRPVASVAQVQATIENVPQNPGTAFTVSGNTITFDGAPASGTNNIYVYYTSPITQVIQPGQGTVGLIQFTASGTPSSSTFLRGDNSWATVTQTRVSGGTTGLTPNTLTGGDVTLAGTLAVANGGTGTASPSLVGGTNITISGTWPNQTVTAASGAPTTAQVLAATAGATAGAVGVYAMGMPAFQVTTSVNGTIAGSGLLYASVYPAGNLVVGAFGTMPGTWKAVSGDQSGSYGGYNLASLWLRIA